MDKKFYKSNIFNKGNKRKVLYNSTSIARKRFFCLSPLQLPVRSPRRSGYNKSKRFIFLHLFGRRERPQPIGKTPAE